MPAEVSSSRQREASPAVVMGILVSMLERYGQIRELHPAPISPGSVECENCGQHNAADQTLTVSAEYSIAGQDRVLCLKCSWICTSCSNPHPCETGYSFVDQDGNKQIACKYSGAVLKCQDCMSSFHKSVIVKFVSADGSSRNTCKACSLAYVPCFECETMKHRASPRCWSCGSDGRLIRQHSYKPTPRFMRLDPLDTSSVFMGFELEADLGGNTEDHVRRIGFGQGELRKQFYIKLDGSVRDGIEVVSHPGTVRFWMKHELPWCPKMVSMGYRSYDTDSCGMHVHVGRSALSRAIIARLLLFMSANKQFIYYISRRKSQPLNNYAKLSNKIGVSKAIRDASGRNEDRYMALNLQNGSTIEFRFFRGTLRPIAIKRNLAFIWGLIEFCRSAPTKDVTSLAAFQAFVKSDLVGKEIGSKRVAASLAKWVNDFDVDFAEEE